MELVSCHVANIDGISVHFKEREKKYDEKPHQAFDIFANIKLEIYFYVECFVMFKKNSTESSHEFVISPF